jgi:hypothetical protein
VVRAGGYAEDFGFRHDAQAHGFVAHIIRGWVFGETAGGGGAGEESGETGAESGIVIDVAGVSIVGGFSSWCAAWIR